MAASNLHDGENGETGRGGATGVAAAGDPAMKDVTSGDGMVGVGGCDAPESDERRSWSRSGGLVGETIGGADELRCDRGSWVGSDERRSWSRSDSLVDETVGGADELSCGRGSWVGSDSEAGSGAACVCRGWVARAVRRDAWASTIANVGVEG